MQFQAGNKFWFARSSHGRNPILVILNSCEMLVMSILNGLKIIRFMKKKIFHSQGMITKDTVTKCEL